MSAARTVAGSLVVTLLALVAGACASGVPSPAAEPRAEAPVEPPSPVQPQPQSVEPAAPAEAEAPRETTGAYGPRTVIIDQGEPQEEEPPTLTDAARLAKEARAREGAPIAVITDETLSEYATGELSIAEEKPAAASPTATEEEQPADAIEERDEEYWRERVKGARMRWRDLVEEISRLEGQVAELRQRFYAEDDGFYRDSQIKPAWDRALDLLAEMRDEVGRAQANLNTILEEGRRAGALPGWLREGIEYEPAAEETDDAPAIHEVTEPPVIDEDGNGRDR